MLVITKEVSIRRRLLADRLRRVAFVANLTLVLTTIGTAAVLRTRAITWMMFIEITLFL